MNNKEILWEVNQHWSKLNDEDSVFTGCSVTPIYVLEENIAPGAEAPTIVFKDSDGRKCRGARRNYFETEEAAWAEIKRDLLESLEYHQSEIKLLQAQCEAITAFLLKEEL